MGPALREGRREPRLRVKDRMVLTGPGSEPLSGGSRMTPHTRCLRIGTSRDAQTTYGGCEGIRFGGLQE